MTVQTIDFVDVISDAITRRITIRIDYPPGVRLVEPHCLGESKEGNLLLRAFQTEGASASGEHINWKLFRLDRADSVELTGDHFDGPRPEYNPDDKAMKGRIISRL